MAIANKDLFLTKLSRKVDPNIDFPSLLFFDHCTACISIEA